MKKIWIGALCVASLMAIGCNEVVDGDGLGEPVGSMAIEFSTHSLALSQANSCDDYRKHVLDSLAREIAYNRFVAYGGGLMYEDGDAVANEPEASPGSNDGGEKAGDYTQTNVQEAGADELDTVKNDGKYMYSVRGNDIHITQVWPPEEMNETSIISLGLDGKHSYGYVKGLMLSGDKLLVLSNEETWEDSDDWYRTYSEYVVVRVYDISDRTAPKLTKTHQADGWLEDARLIKNRLHLVSNVEMGVSWYQLYKLSDADIPGVPKFKSPWDDDDFRYSDWSSEQWDDYYKQAEAWYAARKENIQKYLPNIRAWLEQKYPSIDDFKWPKYSDGKNSRDAVSCADVYIPATTSRDNGVLLISEISGDNFEKYSARALADAGWTIYASTENLYIASNSSYWWSDCMFDDKECKPYSHIHHFNLGDADGQVRYINSAEVSGMVNSQFNMSEYDGHLRVVSSPVYWGNSPSGHSLSVYDIKTPNVMAQTGSVSGFGKDERVYAARMFGKKGFVVTFRNTDPLFTFDLSDPNAPKNVGELHIPGNSTYIHPVGENHLLTIGEDGTEDGRLTGIQLQLFDVTDLANPTQKYKTVIAQDKVENDSYSYGWSEAMYDHHALNYHEGSGLLAVPININSWKAHDYHHFSGMLVYKVGPDKDFELVGGVDHSDLVPKNDYYWWTSLDRARFYFKDAGVYDQNAYVYTISNYGIKVNDANAPKTEIAVVKYQD